MRREINCLMLALAFSLSSFAEAEGETIVANVVPPDTLLFQSEQIHVVIDIDVSEASELLGAYSASVEWNPAILEFVSLSGGKDTKFNDPTTNKNEISSGRLLFNQFNATGSDGVVSVITITFKVIGEPGTTSDLDLEFSALDAAQNFNNLMPFLAINDGSVTVKEEANIEAEVVPTDSNPKRNSQIEAAINIDLSGNSAIFGAYSASVEWNPAVLEFVSLSGGTDSKFNDPTANKNEVSSGILLFNQFNATGSDGVVNVMTVTFKVIGEPGTTSDLNLEFSALDAAVTFNNLLPVLAINDGVITVSKSPETTLLSPNGGETWEAGTTQNITWTALDVTNVKLEYTTDNGTSWTEIVASTAASTGSYSLMVPIRPSENCKVRISQTSYSSVTDMSDGTFTVTESTGETILFNSEREDGKNEIHVINPDGSNQTRLTNNSAHDSTPSWSPDGSKIVFSSNRDGNWNIYSMDADGSNQTRLTNNPDNDLYPSWSPNGSKIAYGLAGIYVMNEDGSNQTKLNEGSHPTWSTDGSKIYFISTVDSNTEIYVMDADGSNQTKLINNSDVFSGFTLSPDGSKLAYNSDKDGNFEIYVLDINDSNQTRLTNDPALDISPSWSPDGSQIVFNSYRDGISEIYIMDADGSNQTRVTNNSIPDYWASWARPIYREMPGEVTLTSPNGGESWDAGTTQNITWTSENVENVKIEYSTDDGSTWTTITTSSDAGSESYAWTVPNVQSSSCIVRINDASNATVTDQSNATFIFFQPVGGLADTPWPMFRQNLQHTGRGIATVAASSTVKWKFQAGGMVLSSSAIGSDGTVYVGSVDTYLYAVKSDGTIKWKFKTGSGIYSSPAIGSDGTVYVGSDDTYLYAVKSDGTLKWKFKTGSGIYSSPAIGSDGTVYVRSKDMYLYAVKSDGTLKWKLNTWYGVYSSPAIGSDGTVYVGSDDTYLYAVKSDGTIKWKFKTGSRIGSSPAIGSDGTVYVGSDDTYLYAVKSDGTIKWKFKTGSRISSSPAIGSDGTVYVGSVDTYLYAVKSDGTIKWKFKTGSGIYSSPAIGSDGTVYVGSDDTYLYAVKSDGTVKWKFKTGSGIYSSPAIGSDGTVYVGFRDGYLYAFAPEITGAVTISDQNLEAAIRSALSKPELPLTKEDLAGLTDLDASEQGISDLTGIEHCVNLQELLMHENQISDLSPLSNLTNLWNLSLHGNQINDLSPLSSLSKLTNLTIDVNQISDLSPLSGLTNLRGLNMGGNQIIDLSPLSNLTNLQGLHLLHNQISDLSPLSSMTNLQELKLQGNQISDLSPLSSMTKLNNLEIGSNQISNLSPLSGLTRIKELSLEINQISDLSPLSNLTNLHLLYLHSNNQISDLSPLSGLTNLEGLMIGGNQISDLSPLSNLTNLQGLRLDGNQISDLNSLRNLTNLKRLYLGDNQIQDISPLEGLNMIGKWDIWDVDERDGVIVHLGLSYNQISDISPLVNNTGIGEGDGIDLRGNPLSIDAHETEISALQARGGNVLFDTPRAVTISDTNLEAAIRSLLRKPEGQLTDVDLAGLTNLNASEQDISDLTGIEHCVNMKSLNLDTNQISDINPLSGLTNLEHLYLGSNQISDLDPLSSLTNLVLLFFNINQISDLSPLSNLTNLENLEMSGNQISDISPLSNLTLLQLIWLDSNQINDISLLSKLTHLLWLSFSNNLISDLSSLSNLTNLVYLSFSDNQISDISHLINLTNLRYLGLDDNQIHDIYPLAGMIMIGEGIEKEDWVDERDGVKIHLGLSNNQISDLSRLISNTGIGEDDGIDMRGNPLSTEALTDIQELQKRGVNILFDEISGKPEVALLSPSGSESWGARISQNITWSSSGVTNVKLEYSTNNGTDWTEIVASTAASAGSYSWITPNVQSSQCLVRITDTGDGSVLDQSYAVFTIYHTKPMMASIPTGTFRMGDISDGVEIVELPVHSVTISSFEMGIYEVTQGQYQSVMGANPTVSYGVGDSYPVYNVSWFDAVEYCNRLSDADGLDRCYDEKTWTCDFSKNGFRLPTEAEWEYACRAGTETKYYTGNNISSDRKISTSLEEAGWYSSNSDSKTHPVGQKDPNAWGLYDMHGNVWEWCSDWFDMNYYDSSPSAYPTGPSSGTGRVYRGGSWAHNAYVCRSAYRDFFSPWDSNYDIGFRVVRGAFSTTSFTLTSPNGGENWDAGSAQNITWTSENVTNVKLKYSTDNGSTWSDIISSTPASSGEYSWDVPDTPSESCLIRIIDASDSNLFDSSDSAFTILPKPTITLTSPNGGENLYIGDTIQITWSSEAIATVKIDYSANNGSTWNPIAASVSAADKSYLWTVPDAPSSNCRVRVSNAANTSFSDQSESSFTISLPSLTLTSPNGGDVWLAGSTQTIAWASNEVSNVNIMYSLNGGTDWILVASGLAAAAGSYEWKAPDISSQSCLIRLADTLDAGNTDTSTTVFTIGYPDINVSKSFVDFGNVPFGSSKTETFVISNTGLLPLMVSVSVSNTADINDNADGEIIVEAGGAITITFTYTPLTASTQNGTVIITSDDPDEVTVSIPVTGTGYESASPIIVENIIIDVTGTNNTDTDTLDVVISLKNVTSQPLSDVSFASDVDGTGLIPWYGDLDSDKDNDIDTIPANSTLTALIGQLYLPSSADHRIVSVTDVTVNGKTYNLTAETEIYFLYAARDEIPYHPAVDGYGFANLPGWSWHAFLDECVRLDSSFDKKSNALFPFFSKFANWKGRSLGMAASSNIYYELPSSKPFSDDTFEEKSYESYITDNIMRYSLSMIQKYFSGGEQAYDSMFDLLTDAKGLLANNHPFVLLLTKTGGSIKAGHAVSVFKVIENEDEGTAVFSVYDCDYADGVPRFITISLDGNTFTYDGNYARAGILVQEALPSVFSISDNVMKPFNQRFVSDLFTDKKDFFGHASPARMLVTDVDSTSNTFGKKIGFVDGTTLVNEINAASVLEIPNEEDGTGYAFYVPHGPDYTVKFIGTETGTMYVDMIAPQSETVAKEVVYEDVAIQSGTIAVIEEIDLAAATAPKIKVDSDGDGTTDTTVSATYESTISQDVQTNFISITSPTAGERISQSAPLEITWSHSGVTNIKIEYSSNNGLTWDTIESSLDASASSYSWATPSIVSAECLIRLTDVAYFNVMDVMSKGFEIYLPQISIDHQVIKEANENSPITFSASVTADSELQDVMVYYDVSGRRVFDNSMRMTSDNGTDYSVSLGSGIFTANGLEYYIAAVDVDNSIKRLPVGTGFFSVQAIVPSVISTYLVEGGSQANSYRMISIPLNLTRISITDQLTGNLPVGDPVYDWRLFQYVNDVVGYKEYPDIDGFSPGKAFWLMLADEKGYRLAAPEGKTVSTSDPFTITLNPGWNTIANPWMFSISWDDKENPSGANLSVPYIYEGNWSDPTNPPDLLVPWKGYVVKNQETFNAVLKLHPTKSSVTSKSVADETNEPLWTIQIAASGGGAMDTTNYFGAHKSSSLSWDRNDHVEPPPIGQYVSVAFPHNDWEKYPADYTVDMRPPDSVTGGWAFDVRTNLPGKEITVSFKESETIPLDMDLAVIDIDTGEDISLFNGAFSFVSGDKLTDRHFTVTVGGTYQPGGDQTNVAPQEFVTARSFPNPFNPSTTISYELSHQTDVVIFVYNTLGQMVRKYDLGMKDAGKYDLVFDTLGLTSGIYIYRVDAGYASVTDKMMFMK